MGVYNLSPFRNPPDAIDDGKWTAPRDQLGEWARRLDDPPGQKTRIQDTKSVPDPWAQARAFAESLLNPAHPQHGGTAAQWRAVVALLALERQRGAYRISPRGMKLISGAQALDTVLLALEPAVALPQDGLEPEETASWSEPWLLAVEPVVGATDGGEPIYGPAETIGLFNPASLVAAGRVLWRAPHDCVPWMADGDWVDPLTIRGRGALTAADHKLLRAFLSELSAGVRAVSKAAQDPIQGQLLHRIEEFIQACDRAQAYPVEPIRADAPAVTGMPRLYRLLRTSFRIEAGDPIHASDCRIEARALDGVANPYDGFILVDPTIALTLGLPPHDVRVWGEQSLASVLDSPAALTALRAEAARERHLVITPDMLFSGVLAKLVNEGGVPGHRANPDFAERLLPISPLALLLMEPGELVRRLSLEAHADREVVTLGLSLQPGAASRDPDTPISHGVSRIFAEKPGEGEGRLVRKADWGFGQQLVWPNIASRQWNWYFALLRYADDTQALRGRFAMSGVLLADLIRPLAAPAQLSAMQNLANSTGHPTLLSGERLVVEEGGERNAKSLATFERRSWQVKASGDGDAGRGPAVTVTNELERSSTPFEAIFFGYGQPQSREMAPAGLAVLALDAVEEATAAGRVAVDFGTTATVASFDAATPVVFQSRLTHPLSIPDRKQDAYLAHLKWDLLEFFPAEDRSLPTATAQLKRDSDLAAAAEDPEILMSSLIYFQPLVDVNAGGEDPSNFDREMRRTALDLKWGQDLPTIVAAKRFLRQLMMMISIEGLERGLNPDLLTWTFSRPNAMPSGDWDGFHTTIVEQLRIVRPGLEAARARHWGAGGPPAVSALMSEARAACTYVLRTPEFNRGDVNVILDIGGGTTDVALTRKDVPIWQTSFKLAGKDFFTRHIANNPAVLAEIGLGGWADVLESDALRGGPLAGASDLGRLPSKEDVSELLFMGPQLETALQGAWGARSVLPELQALVQTAETFLGGVAWYTGLACREMIRHGELDAGLFARPAFALCGRGSGLFVRLHRGAMSPLDSSLGRLLRLFGRAAGVEPRAPIVVTSDVPKMEVVKGMILDHKLRADGIALAWDDEGIEQYLPSGLRLRFNGFELAPEHDISQREGRGTVLDADLGEFDAFLDALAQETGYRIDLRKEEDQGSGRNIAINVETSAGAEPMREPPFIAGLRQLVSDMATAGRPRLAIGKAEPPRRKTRLGQAVAP